MIPKWNINKQEIYSRNIYLKLLDNGFKKISVNTESLNGFLVATQCLHGQRTKYKTMEASII